MELRVIFVLLLYPFAYFSCINDVHVLFYNFKMLFRNIDKGNINS